MGAKQCELCDRAARIYCESDQASLCWECDGKVHGANFLVARHSRCLLCRSCQSPTPWRAEGARLGPTVSVCERCSVTASAKGSGGIGCDVGGEEEEEEEEEEEGEGGGREEGDREEEDEDEEEEDGDSDDVDEDDDEGDNQVVPWSLTPPPVASSSSSEEEHEEESGRARNGGGFLKRMRESADLAVSQDGLACSSSPSYLAAAPSRSLAIRAAAEDEASSFASALRPSKDRKRATLVRSSVAADTDADTIDIRVHGNHRRGAGLMNRRFLSSTNQDRYKNIEG